MKLSGALHSVSELSLEQDNRRRHSSAVSLHPLSESLINVRKASSSTLSVPGNSESATGRRKFSLDDFERTSYQGSGEICLEIAQSGNTGNETHEISAEKSIEISPQENTFYKERFNAVIVSSLNSNLATVCVTNPLERVALVRNSTKALSKSHSSLRTFLSPKLHRKGHKNARSVPSSPVSKRSVKL